MPAGASSGPACHDVRALRVAAGEVEAAVEEGQVRGEHNVLGAHDLTAGGADAAAVHIRGHRPLVDRPVERRGEPPPGT